MGPALEAANGTAFAASGAIANVIVPAPATAMAAPGRMFMIRVRRVIAFMCLASKYLASVCLLPCLMLVWERCITPGRVARGRSTPCNARIVRHLARQAARQTVRHLKSSRAAEQSGHSSGQGHVFWINCAARGASVARQPGGLLPPVPDCAAPRCGYWAAAREQPERGPTARNQCPRITVTSAISPPPFCFPA